MLMLNHRLSDRNESILPLWISFRKYSNIYKFKQVMYKCEILSLIIVLLTKNICSICWVTTVDNCAVRSRLDIVVVVHTLQFTSAGGLLFHMAWVTPLWWVSGVNYWWSVFGVSSYIVVSYTVQTHWKYWTFFGEYAIISRICYNSMTIKHTNVQCKYNM